MEVKNVRSKLDMNVIFMISEFTAILTTAESPKFSYLAIVNNSRNHELR